MHYRRNADQNMRQAEREYLQDPSTTNLIAYNRARKRAALLPVEASISSVREFIERELAPHYWAIGITGLQFNALEVRFDVTKGTSRVKDSDAFLAMYNLLQSKIPTILDLGYVVLLKQEGIVTLKIVRDSDYNEYIVEWREDGKLVDRKSYHTDDKDDAKATMKHMQTYAHPQKYPEFYVIPQSTMRPSGRLASENIASGSAIGGVLIADAWQKDSDPRTLTDPTLRRGTYPSEVLLVRYKDPDAITPTGHPDIHAYFTTMWRVPYDRPGVSGYRDHGNYDMTLEQAKADYVVRLLKLPNQAHYRIYD